MERHHGTTPEAAGDGGAGASVGRRAQLAKTLLVSLDDDPGDDPAEVERAWELEIRRRLAELEAGTAELIPAEEVFAELRARPRR